MEELANLSKLETLAAEVVIVIAFIYLLSKERMAKKQTEDAFLETMKQMNEQHQAQITAMQSAHAESIKQIIIHNNETLERTNKENLQNHRDKNADQNEQREKDRQLYKEIFASVSEAQKDVAKALTDLSKSVNTNTEVTKTTSGVLGRNLLKK